VLASGAGGPSVDSRARSATPGWGLPILIVSAAGNACAEEVLLTGYLLTQVRRLGWTENAGLAVSALLRGCYHLYQGFGGAVGNLVMGAVFGRVWQRTGRVWAMGR
jgi:membrane protease YdiL (CAAX protease family)